MCQKIAGCVLKSVKSGQMPYSVASALGLHCLLRPVCPNTLGIAVGRVCRDYYMMYYIFYIFI